MRYQARIEEHSSAAQAVAASPPLPHSLRINHALGSVTVFHFVGLSLGPDQLESSR